MGSLDQGPVLGRRGHYCYRCCRVVLEGFFWSIGSDSYVDDSVDVRCLKL